MNWDDMALVGRVARSHGNRGEVIVNPETSFPEERFGIGRRVYMKRQDRVEPLTITAMRFYRERPIVAFEGFASIDDAEQLAGAELRVPDEALTKLPPGMFYHHDLIGCVVTTAAGQTVGTVAKVDGSGERTSLIVEGGRGEVMVPLVDEICRQIDVANRRIVIEPPAGLLDVNT
jgi:16S rRNA processing protein RimM